MMSVSKCQTNEVIQNSSGKFDILAEKSNEDEEMSFEEENSSSLDSEEKIIKEETGWITVDYKKNPKKKRSKPISVSSTSEDDISDPEYRSRRKIFRKTRAQTSNGTNNKTTTAGDSSKKDKSSVNNNINNFTNNSKNKSPKDNPKSNNVKPLPPPPIKVIGINSMENIKKILKSASEKEEYVIRFLSNEMWKINPLTETAYRSITAELNKNNLQWYSHADKNNRNIKVMCRGLPSTLDPEEIIQDLKDKNFKIISAVCMQKKSRN
ncbi:uncharacterized protein [Bemisia tabaci]|uniref:uncharacterized protein n=1 Tax=Bemisia tabaci TaxID=7038 RepID=UPI003B288EF5